MLERIDVCGHNNIHLYDDNIHKYTERCIIFSVLKTKFKERSFEHLPPVFYFVGWIELLSTDIVAWFWLSLLMQWFDYKIHQRTDIDLFSSLAIWNIKPWTIVDFFHRIICTFNCCNRNIIVKSYVELSHQLKKQNNR